MSFEIKKRFGFLVCHVQLFQLQLPCLDQEDTKACSTEQLQKRLCYLRDLV